MTRKTLVIILLALMAAWMIWYWWPWFTPFLLQHHHFSLNALLLEKQPADRAINEPNGMPTPASWLFLVLMGVTLLVVRGLVVKPSKAHGSARNATRRDTRNYRARSQSSRGTFRLPGLAALLAPVQAITAYRPGWLAPKAHDMRNEMRTL